MFTFLISIVLLVFLRVNLSVNVSPAETLLLLTEYPDDISDGLNDCEPPSAAKAGI